MSALIRIDELSARLGGVSIPTINRFVKAGVLPRPVKLGHRTVRWRLDEVDAAIEQITGQWKDTYGGQKVA
jgi:predicted DNA-binding transcriptional regulator AlpA